MMAEINLTERCEMTCEILQATNDGDDLDPQHLWLGQEWVNDTLNEKGEQTFHELYQNVKQGYKPPWFHDIENLLRCQNGYVYWKGKQVEHYDSPWAYSSEGKKSAEELASRCRHLESIGVEVNSTNAVWLWEERYKPKENVTML
jgi:hypothetical protein